MQLPPRKLPPLPKRDNSNPPLSVHSQSHHGSLIIRSQAQPDPCSCCSCLCCQQVHQGSRNHAQLHLQGLRRMTNSNLYKPHSTFLALSTRSTELQQTVSSLRSSQPVLPRLLLLGICKCMCMCLIIKRQRLEAIPAASSAARHRSELNSSLSSVRGCGAGGNGFIITSGCVPGAWPAIIRCFSSSAGTGKTWSWPPE